VRTLLCDSFWLIFSCLSFLMRKAMSVMLYALAVIISGSSFSPTRRSQYSRPVLKAVGRTRHGRDARSYLGALTDSETPPACDVVSMKNGSIVYSKAFGLADVLHVSQRERLNAIAASPVSIAKLTVVAGLLDDLAR
jgi:hypothetical protein